MFYISVLILPYTSRTIEGIETVSRRNGDKSGRKRIITTLKITFPPSAVPYENRR